MGVCVAVCVPLVVCVPVTVAVAVLEGVEPKESEAVGVGVCDGVCVGVAVGGTHAVRMTEPAAPTPVAVGEPPRKLTAP